MAEVFYQVTAEFNSERISTRKPYYRRDIPRYAEAILFGLNFTNNIH